MAIFALEINQSNDAFQDGFAGMETARILRELADRVEDGAAAGAVQDHNGNTVGRFHLR